MTDVKAVAHTPGPWMAVDDEILTEDGGVRIADVPLHDGLNPVEWEENCHLLAAAPELLAACREVVLAAVNVSDGCAICGCDLDATPPHYAGCAVGIAVSAIAKAEGQPS